MSISFDNLYAGETDGNFMFFIKDREVETEERWVAAFLTKDETKKLYEYLKEHLE